MKENQKENYPKSIEPCPILEATVEIRCVFSIPGDAVIGVIYNKFLHDFTLSSLSINQIPIELRKTDPNLRYKPTHRLINNNNPNLIIDIGTDVIMFTYVLEYEGWDIFKPFIEDSLNVILDLSIIYKVENISLKYLNFFKNNIFDFIELKVALEGETIGKTPTVIRTEINSGTIVHVLQIANSAHVKNEKFSSDGSIIDITSIIKVTGIIVVEFILLSIDRLHDSQKTLFFSLFTSEFLKTLNPKYNE